MTNQGRRWFEQRKEFVGRPREKALMFPICGRVVVHVTN